MATTVRISPHGHQVLTDLARETASPLTDVLDVALEAFRRLRLLDQANAGYATLASDPAAWDSYRQEMDALDATASDGLETFKP